ncbi:hypothetical protein [Paenibacillus sp. MMS18-CY102]|uniref:hypothetical protein n=1 Tax=Paenibacillus sp. MMS18-CY102 TaxID=2682849 RepID=UPI0013658E25|nr:hypothetical protein [Paenibacillus sp. MMS18-CY102]MWC27812.1 hypothetical protein [Paenibacillus sp. MMS18-CY102]
MASQIHAPMQSVQWRIAIARQSGKLNSQNIFCIAQTATAAYLCQLIAVAIAPNTILATKTARLPFLCPHRSPLALKQRILTAFRYTPVAGFALFRYS